MGMEMLHNVQSLKMLWKLKEVKAWLYIHCRSVKEMDETKSSQLRREKKSNAFRSQRVKIWFEIPAKGFKTRATARAVIDSTEKVYVYRNSRSRGRKWLG